MGASRSPRSKDSSAIAPMMEGLVAPCPGPMEPSLATCRVNHSSGCRRATPHWWGGDHVAGELALARLQLVWKVGDQRNSTVPMSRFQTSSRVGGLLRDEHQRGHGQLHPVHFSAAQAVEWVAVEGFPYRRSLWPLPISQFTLRPG